MNTIEIKQVFILDALIGNGVYSKRESTKSAQLIMALIRREKKITRMAFNTGISRLVQV